MLIDPAIPTQSGHTILPEAQRAPRQKPLVVCHLKVKYQLRPVGGVKHSDSDLVETGELTVEKALC